MTTSRRNWTKEDEAYLSEKWGQVSIKTLAKSLGRTENAIIVRKGKLGLGGFLESGDYITFNQFTLAFCGSNSGNSYKIKSWVKNRGFPMRTKVVNSMRVKIVYLHEFWKWAEQHRSFLDFSRMEPLSLGAEPDWVKEQRRKDYQAFAAQRKDPWTEQDDARLKALLKEHRYGYAELSRMLQRSAGAIQRRCSDLGLKERPVRVSPHEGHWSDGDYITLAEGIRNGDSYTAIGEQIGKSEKAIRGKVYTVYFTESEDKIRRMMGAGPWGSGAPSPKMRQAMNSSQHRQEAKDLAADLVSLLTYRLRTMDQDNPYWQRRMCMHWDDVRCLKGCANCDECSHFQRIQPQYCARCGATFYERRENRFCQACRTARKKQAQRRWARQRGGINWNLRG